MAISTVFFDLDGTLIDTEPTAARVLEKSLTAWGISVNREDAQYVVGRTWASAFDYIFGRYNPPLARADAEAAILKEYHSSIQRDLPTVPGAVQAVRSLAASGDLRLALVSGSHHATIEWALNQLSIRDCFEIVLGSEDYPRGKPAPDPYQEAGRLLNAAPQTSLVFEDSTAGIDSGLAAGCWVVAVTAANHFAQDISRAHHQILDFQNVNPAWLEQFSTNRPSR